MDESVEIQHTPSAATAMTAIYESTTQQQQRHILSSRKDAGFAYDSSNSIKLEFKVVEANTACMGPRLVSKHQALSVGYITKHQGLLFVSPPSPLLLPTPCASATRFAHNQACGGATTAYVSLVVYSALSVSVLRGSREGCAAVASLLALAVVYMM